MPFHLLRRTHKAPASAISVLILATTPEAAIDLGMRVRTLGCIAIEPRLGESGDRAIERLRPNVVMVQADREDLATGTIDSAVEAAEARMIVFGKQWPNVVDIARSHSALSLPIDAPAKMIRSAIQLVAPM